MLMNDTINPNPQKIVTHKPPITKISEEINNKEHTIVLPSTYVTFSNYN